MLIAVSGTPGTGKTTVAKWLARKLGLQYVSLNDYARKHGMVVGRDEKRKADEVDVDRLRKVKFEDAVLEGHFSHELLADVKIVLRLHPSKLEERLEEKGWGAEKIRENCEAEAMGIIAEEAGPEAYEVVSDENVLSNALKAVAGKLERRRYDFSDWL